MTAHLTLESKSEALLRLVSDFAHGLGAEVDTPPGSGLGAIRIALPDTSDDLLELVSHIALSATRAGVALDEPTCRVTFRHANAPSMVTLALRIAAFDIESPARA